MADLRHPHAGTAHDPTDNVEVQHEESDVNIRAIFGFGAALIVVAIVVHVAVWGFFRFLESRAGQRVEAAFPLAASQPGERLPPEPRLQTAPREDLAALRAREDETLRSYGWVDRNAGVVRIPIDRAVELTLQRGLPARQGGR